MTQEYKDLLLQDICARLPYGVKCSYLDIEFNNTTHGNLEGFEYDDDKDVIFVIDGIGIYSEHVKPYLFPMSSMSDEDYEEYSKLWDLQDEFPSDADIRFKVDVFDWLNKKGFDYRGLIPKGLAIDATRLNIY